MGLDVNMRICMRCRLQVSSAEQCKQDCGDRSRLVTRVAVNCGLLCRLHLKPHCTSMQ